MAKRRNQTAEEIADLADRFRESWNEGRVLRSWLKAHADEILELAKNHWSWENLGKALTSAGITYQTGTPWTGENLRRNLKRTLIPGKRELKLLRMGPGPDGDPPSPPPSAPTSPVALPLELTAAPPPSVQPELEFKLIRRRPRTAVDGAMAGNATVTPLPVRPPPRTLSDEEALALAFGRKTANSTER